MNHPIFYIGNESHVEVDVSCTHNCGDHVRPLVSGRFDTLKNVSTPFHPHSFHFRAHADEGPSPSHAITVQGRNNSVDKQISCRQISRAIPAQGRDNSVDQQISCRQISHAITVQVMWYVEVHCNDMESIHGQM